MEAKNKLVSAILSYPPETMAEAERRADEILEALALPVDNTSGDSDG
jgi:nitrate reductase assembly molybdenum cofactor insertion protein NarJ